VHGTEIWERGERRRERGREREREGERESFVVYWRSSKSVVILKTNTDLTNN